MRGISNYKLINKKRTQNCPLMCISSFYYNLCIVKFGVRFLSEPNICKHKVCRHYKESISQRKKEKKRRKRKDKEEKKAGEEEKKRFINYWCW